MSPDIVAVLVVPAEGDPGGLLRAGAPVYDLRDDLEGWVVDGESGTRVHAPTEGDGDRHPLDDAWALLLWWDGALVPEGWDRFTRVVAPEFEAAPEHDSIDPPDCIGEGVHYGSQWVPLDPDYHAAFAAVYDRHPELDAVLALADYGSRTVARVVRLARVDGRLVEVSDDRG